MNWFEYYIGHCWMSGWQGIRGSFRIWADLMTGNYKDYALLPTDDPYEECLDWFWGSLGEDEVLPKAFLEHLLEMCDRIDRGEEELIPADEDFFDRMKDLLKDVELEEYTDEQIDQWIEEDT